VLDRQTSSAGYVLAPQVARSEDEDVPKRGIARLIEIAASAESSESEQVQARSDASDPGERAERILRLMSLPPVGTSENLGLRPDGILARMLARHELEPGLAK
jgi:hypothetical protein